MRIACVSAWVRMLSSLGMMWWSRQEWYAWVWMAIFIVSGVSVTMWTKQWLRFRKFK